MLLDLENIKIIFLDVLSKSIAAAYASNEIDFTNIDDFEFSMNYRERVTLRLTHKSNVVYSSSFSSYDKNILNEEGLREAINYGLMLAEHDDSSIARYTNEIYSALRTFEKYGITFEYLMAQGNFKPEDLIRYHEEMHLPLPKRN